MQAHSCDGNLGCFSDTSGGLDVQNCMSYSDQSPLYMALYLEGLIVLSHTAADSALYNLCDI